MGWGDYFYYCYYYYYYYYNYYLKNTKQNHRQKEEEARKHFSGSHGIVGSEKVVGGGEHPLDSQPWDGQMDGRMDRGRSGSPALEDDGRKELGATLAQTHTDAGDGGHEPSGHRGMGCPGRRGAPGLLALGRGGRGRRSPATPSTRLCPGSWCGQRSALPAAPCAGDRLCGGAGSSAVLVHFFASGSGGLGEPGPGWTMTCS